MLIKQSSNNFFKRKNNINLNGELIDLTRPVVMGVLNVSPDSFFDGGKYTSEKKILKRAEQMLNEGATFIDVGAVSTRPRAEDIPTKKELDLLLPAVKAIRKKFPETRISLDTYRSWVALQVIEECGPCMVNDVTGGEYDVKMFETIARLNMPYILTHIQGTPQTMQDDPQYEDIIKEISTYLSKKARVLSKLGAHDVIIDPGIGFGKTLDQNYALLNKLDSFKTFQLPVLFGASRKSMIYKLLDTNPEQSLNGTSVVNTLALLGGADILRVHDVKEAVDTIEIVEKIREMANNG